MTTAALLTDADTQGARPRPSVALAPTWKACPETPGAKGDIERKQPLGPPRLLVARRPDKVQPHPARHRQGLADALRLSALRGYGLPSRDGRGGPRDHDPSRSLMRYGGQLPRTGGHFSGDSLSLLELFTRKRSLRDHSGNTRMKYSVTRPPWTRRDLSSSPCGGRYSGRSPSPATPGSTKAIPPAKQSSIF
jgi:hypothetical protein